MRKRKSDKMGIYQSYGVLEVYKRLFKYAFKSWYLFVPAIISTVVLNVFGNMSPRITQYILDKILGNDSLLVSEKKELMVKYILIYVGVAFITILFRYIVSLFYNLASMTLEKDVRNTCIEKLNRLPISYFDHEPDGKIVTKLDNDVEGLRTSYTVFLNITQAIINLIIVYVNLVLLNRNMALYVLVVVPFILVWITVFRKIAYRLNAYIRELRSKINAKINELVVGVSVIQIFNQEESMMKDYTDLVREINVKQFKSNQVSICFGWELLLVLKRFLTALVICYFGIVAIGSEGIITVGLIYAFTEYIDRLAQPLNMIFNNLNELEDSMVAANRVFAFLDQDEDIEESQNELKSLNGQIQFEHLSFSYLPGVEVLHDINLEVQPGTCVGIVGATGSGKSSLMNILCRFYEYEKGEIYLDGKNIKEYNKKSFRSQIGIVVQTPSIFKGTLRSNLTLGDSSITDEKIWSVLNEIGASDLATKYEEGLDAKIDYKGENLSVGEKQLISFARILLNDPKILILDEATANIDTETEIKIKHAMSVITKGRTAFIIAHRLSTIKDADVILVLEHGSIVGKGTHEELMETSKDYKEMYSAQYREAMMKAA